MTTPASPDAIRPGADGPQRSALTDDQTLERRDAVEVVRSEERLDVGTVVRVSGRAVLRRYVVTETVTQTFQVRHEEFRVDHEPLVDGPRADDADAVVDEGAFRNRVVETVLHREVPVVAMQVVATERVRVHVDTVTDQVRVSEEVARERVDVDVPDHGGTSGGA
jgi:stress response protein YsnF